MIRRLVSWLDDRLGGSSFAAEALNKVFPDHWAFLLGEIALYCFTVLVLTGTFLTFFFTASTAPTVYRGAYAPLNGAHVSSAYASVVRLSFDVRAGLVMRQIHHWTAVVFVAAIVAHLCRIFFTGAFRRPREINWVIGVVLLILAIFNGFTGYSLPDDLLSGTGLRIAYSIAISIPVIGTWIAFLLFGGPYGSPGIIGRLFVIHILFIPALIGALLGAHLGIVWRQKHSQFPGPGRLEGNVVGEKLWPTYAAKSMGLFFGVAAVVSALGGLLQINPVWQYGPYVVSQVSSPAQPDWYLGWLEGALRIFPAWETRVFGFEIPNAFFPAVLLPGITFTLLFAWPFIESWATGDHLPHHLLDRPRDRPVRTALGLATLTFYTVLLAAGSNDLLAKWFQAPVEVITWTFRVLVIVLPLVVGFVVYRLMKALKASGAARLSRMPARALSDPAAVRARLAAHAPAAAAATADGALDARRIARWVAVGAGMGALVGGIERLLHRRPPEE
ncbi:MAG TPA: ubiquinol-cytochrome c reductase cytochrome b subunit [Actinomycetota bacterium]|nr:ubiquinol-cytochrome c reductase cytochrome b subunit [Actinomycetota bacterium]